MTERLISGAAAEACFLKWAMRDHAARLAALVHWGGYTSAEALEEMQGLTLWRRNRAGYKCDHRRAGRELLIEVYREQAGRHQDTAKAVKSAVLAELRAGGDQERAAAMAAEVAQSAALPPPPHIFADAIESALREFRFASARWNRRGAS
jgi:hypothetical protein